MELRTIIISIESINNKLERAAEIKSKEKRGESSETDGEEAGLLQLGGDKAILERKLGEA